MAGFNCSLAAITIAHEVVNHTPHPETESYASVADKLVRDGHTKLLRACNTGKVTEAYIYKDCSKAIAVLRETFPGLMVSYPEGAKL